MKDCKGREIKPGHRIFRARQAGFMKSVVVNGVLLYGTTINGDYWDREYEILRIQGNGSVLVQGIQPHRKKGLIKSLPWETFEIMNWREQT